jgi:hypothetical protein
VTVIQLKPMIALHVSAFPELGEGLVMLPIDAMAAISISPTPSHAEIAPFIAEIQYE